MRIFLVRHGKDDGNYRGGWSLVPLTEEGINQVKKLAEFLNTQKDYYNIEKIYPGLYYNTLRIDERYLGGESTIEFHDRIIKDFKDIVKENKNHNNIMIVTHSGVINIIYRYINNMEWSNKIKSIKVSNASIYSLILDNNNRYFEPENYNEYLK